MESRLDIMARMMDWRHIVPTAPDTLTSYPFPTSDPFMMQTAPHVFFAGNQPQFAQRLIEGVAEDSATLFLGVGPVIRPWANIDIV